MSSEAAKEDLMTLLGFFLGDGWTRAEEKYGRYEIGLSVFNDKLKEKYSNILNDIFGITTTGNNEGTIVFSSKEVYQKLEYIGITGKSINRTIPSWIMTLTENLQLAFINGYLEADGYINNTGAWVFEANNNKIIERLRMMLVHLGFSVSNVHERLREPTEIKGKTATPSGPSFSFQAYPNYSKSKNTTIYGDTTHLPDFLCYERIRKIDTLGEEDTYDLKIEKSHNFFADGVLAHNSGGACFLLSTGEFIGVPSRITVRLTGFSTDAITHMMYFIPISSVYDFLEDQVYMFIYDDATNSDECAEIRKKKRERDEKMRAIDVSREGDKEETEEK